MSLSHKHHRSLFASLMAAGLVLSSCGGGEQSGAGSAAAGQASPSAATPAAPRAPTGPIDEALAQRGEQLFQAKTCVGCHTIGKGRLTGPDLEGVTERRAFNWILTMIQHPDSMIRDDSIAHRLFGEYMTPMANMNVTPDEARALYEYLRKETTESH